MTNRSAAARYAKALLDVAIKETDPQQVERDLAGFAELLAGNPALHKALTNPAVPPSNKRKVIEELVSRAAPAPVVAKLLLMLAERDRLELVGDLLAAYHDRLLVHLKIVQADVTTATPLAADRAEALQRRLQELTGRTVVLNTRVDSAIIGGVVARIGSTVYDGSVATQLARMREKLVERVE